MKTFEFDTTIENGEIRAIINTPDGHNIYLTPENPQFTADVIPGKYFLTIEFRKAYGKFILSCK